MSATYCLHFYNHTNFIVRKSWNQTVLDSFGTTSVWNTVIVIAGKYNGESNLVVWVETTKFQSANIISAHNALWRTASSRTLGFT